MRYDETQYNNILSILEKSPSISPETVYNDDNINESNAMVLVFSDLFNYNKDDINYFIRFISKLGYVNIDPKYYSKDMIQGYDNGVLPKNNTELIDIDVSFYNRTNLLKYYFLLDTISEIYGYLKKTGKKSNTVTIKCRYFIDNSGVWKLYTKKDYYTFDISFQSIMEEEISSYKITNVKDVNDVVVKNMCNEISSDIIRHLNYISNTDIAYSEKIHLQNIETFYKFCRLKLKYRTILCLYNHISDKNSIEIFIKNNFIHCFRNFKTYIDIYNEQIDGEQNKVSNDIINSMNNLEKSNDEIKKGTKKIDHNNRRIKAFNKSYIQEVLYAVFVTVIFFISIAFIITGIDIPKKQKIILNSIIVLLSILVYTMSYLVTNNYSVERFSTNKIEEIKEIDEIEEIIKTQIQDMVTDVANNIIVSALKKEDKYYSNQVNDVRKISHYSTNDLNTTIRKNILIKKAIMLIANFFILTMVFIILGRKYSLGDTIYSIIVSYLIIFGIFLYDVVRIVQTNPYQYYWKKPAMGKS